MIAQELEAALHRAFLDARDQAHKSIGVEHLLRAVLDTVSAVRTLQACGVDLSSLRRDLSEYIAANTPLSTIEEAFEPKTTEAFQRVLQRAILKAQSSGKKEVAGADVLLAILADGKRSHAADVLIRLGATSPRVADHVSEQRKDDLQVVLYNDDVTPKQYMIDVLEAFFDMTREDASETVHEVHRQGAAVCGLYSRQTAEDLVAQVSAHARAHGYPLRCAAVAPK